MDAGPRGRISGVAAGIYIRHSRSCKTPRADGKCCDVSYRATVFDVESGKLIRRTFKTRTEAKRWRQDALVGVRAGRLSAVVPGGRTVENALEELLAGMADGTILDRSGRPYRPATIRSYESDSRRYLIPALGTIRLGELRRKDVQRLVDRLRAGDPEVQRKGLAGSTIRNILDPLRVVCRRALEDDEIQTNPTDRLRLPALSSKPRQVASRDRAATLLDALPDADRALWTTLFYAGLRIGEARALRWHHVDFEAGLIRVEAAWDDVVGEQGTKTAAGVRTVPLTGRVRAALAAHKLATGRQEDELCFGRTRQDAFVRSTVRSKALAAWRAAGLDPLSPHEARHTCASYLAAAGVPIKDVQTALGHADVRTTLNIYAKAVPGWEREAAARLDSYLEADGTQSGSAETLGKSRV